MQSLPKPIASQRRQGHRSGIALVIVLAMLVLLSGIMIAFISSANTENVSAKTSAQGVEARQAAETATNFVIAQIREATKDTGGTSTWISQPGAIRTLGKTSTDNQVFKLYSSGVMQVPESSYDPASAAESGLDGTGNAATPVPGYVDINAPAFVPAPGSTAATPTYEARYPIVSPYGKYAYTASTKQFTTGTEPVTAGSGAVEGFYCGGYKDTAHKDSSNLAIPLLPMRVKWLYILKDGTIAGTKADGKTIIGATAGNPPVARTGFWVDDDSCKLNINTATEGTFWDTPVVTSIQESGQKDGSENPASLPPASLNLAMAQPVRAEYQRFPGHPATTCLSPAIRWLFNDPSLYPYPPVANSPDTEFKEAVYRLAPRVKETFGPSTNADSSKGGTYRTRALSPPRVPDTDRLYASLDEYFFRPDRTGRDYVESAPATHAAPTTGTTSQDVAIPGFTPENLEKLRFFLTASSRSPELNVFGKPRVTIWPINNNTSQRSAFDDLFEYCSRVGGKPFNFTRSDPNSATNDFNNIARNIEIYKYLQDMTKTSIPFLQKSIENKYGRGNRDQLLTEIFDYIRSTNLVDTEVGSHGVFTPTRTDGLPLTNGDNTYPLGYTRFFWSNLENSDTNFAAGQVIPIHISAQNNPSGLDTRGFGRFVSPDEIGFLFCRVPPVAPDTTPNIRVVLLMSMFTPGCGYPGLAERYTIHVNFGDPAASFKVVPDTTKPTVSVPLGFVDSYNLVDVDAYTAPVGRMFMPSRGFANQFLYSLKAGNWSTAAKTFVKPNKLTGGTIDGTKYPFFSEVIKGIPATAKQIGFIGGTMTIEIWSRHPGVITGGPINETQDLVQSITLKFPDNNSGGNLLPLPKPRSDGPLTDFKDRLTRGINGNRNNLSAGDFNSGYRWIEDGDVIRSMDLGGTIAKGDSRLVAINGNIVQTDPAKLTYFAPRGGNGAADPYNAGTKMRVHGFRMGRGGSYYANDDSQYDVNDGTLVPNSGVDNRRKDRQAKLPAKIGTVALNGVTMSNGNAGDWDRGISKNMDGPFINRADEGNVNFEPGALGIPYYLGFSGAAEVGPTYFSPNRLMPSAVMFGGLPSRAVTDNAVTGDPAAWETLLFRPQAFANEHRGGYDTLPDHYLLDLFHMPVVEPYAISEPLSTAGKINLNYVIAPFGYVKPAGAAGAYIERKTGLHAILKPVMMLLVPGNANNYAHAPDDPTQTSTVFRFAIDRTATLKEIENRINTKGLFRTASEICEVPLYPVGAAGTPTAPNPLGWQNFWNTYSLTGDNMRERPYATIYPRVTTKSNVFTAYIRAQSIRKNPNTAVDVFDEAKDQITGEYRGSTTIERFIDPNDPAIGTYDPSSATTGNLDQYYRYRIVNTKRFSP